MKRQRDDSIKRITRTQVNRRHLLRGAGALIALPALESIGFRRFASAAATAPTKPPKRMVFLGFGFGVTQETWFPTSMTKERATS